MPFGEILTGSFQLIWRHKKLLIFAVIGLALYALGMLIYQLAGAVWIGRYFDWLNELMRDPGTMPPDMMGDFFTGMAAVWIGMAAFMALSLLGYFVGLVTTSGLILEADRARDGETVDLGRGLREGLGRAGQLFLIQLLWALPWVFIIGLWVAGSIALIVASAGDTVGREPDGVVASLWLLCCCGSVFVGLLYAAFAGIFSPTMQQSAVAGRRSVGAAIREGWALARANLGGVIIIWLLLMLAGFVVMTVAQIITMIASLPLTGVWFAGFGSLMDDAQRGVMPQLPRISGPLYMITSIFSLLVTLVAMWLLQTFAPVVWNGVYRHLKRSVAVVSVAPADDVDGGDAVILDREDAE